MKIYGKSVVLRPIEPRDFPSIVSWNNDPDVSDCYQDDCPMTLDQCESWYQALQSDRHKQRFAICTADDTLIGDIELDHIAWRSGDAELRVRVAEPAYRGQGLGKDAILTLLQYGFETLNLSRIYLRVLSTNHTAINCYRKCGFRKEGRLVRKSPHGNTEICIYLMTIRREDFLKQHHAVGA